MIFKHRCVQDLAWVIQSPPVISGDFKATRWLDNTDCQREYTACLSALHQLDQQPQPLLEQLSRIKSYVIGKRFECYVRYWLTISPNFECLMHNYVVQGETRTLGEVDFIIRQLATNKIIHLEVAVKFYLGINRDINSRQRVDIAAMQHWHGTNLRDRLDIKVNHLVNHQTQLAKKYPERMPYPIDASWCLLKGRMFSPFFQQRLPDFFAENCPQGGWLYAENSPKIAGLRLEKSDWLAEIVASSDQLNMIDNEIDHSACFAAFESKKSNKQQCNETARFFILPPNFF